MRYRGLLYRALNPRYAREPLSGRGALLYGGRFNAKGTPALYLSLSVLTALREANQVGTLQPTTLVCYEAAIDALCDTRDEAALRAHGFDADGLSNPSWRDQMRQDGVSRSQAFAARVAERHDGLLVRSFAAGSEAADRNLVVWRWNGPTSRLRVIDDEGRLSDDRSAGQAIRRRPERMERLRTPLPRSPPS